MKITVIGTGYVGLVSGTCFADLGWNVTAFDKNKDKILQLQQGHIPIYEPGLEEMVHKNKAAGRLSFTLELKEALKEVDIILLAVGTPMGDEGNADLSALYQAIEEVSQLLSKPAFIMVKSTVPVGTNRQLAAYLQQKAAIHCEVISNPEFLREGAAITDFMQPDRIVVGVNSLKSADIAKKLYSPLIARNIPFLETSWESAELIKYASNGFLATKIAFINEMADLCEAVGGNIEEVAKGMGLDQRIGNKFLQAGPGYGGSCFPKDTAALAYTARQYDAPSAIIETVIESNTQRKYRMVTRITKRLGDIRDKTLAIWGVTFKANTDDIRESPALVIIPELLKKGAKLKIYDPAGMENAKKLLDSPFLEWCHDRDHTVKGADALIIITEWKEFTSSDFASIKAMMKTPHIIDLRNILDETKLRDLGITYLPIGKGWN